MAIIKKANVLKKVKIKAEINADTLNTINQYCEWAGISHLGYFIEEAASFVFAKDKEWKQVKKKAKKSKDEL